MRNASLEGYLNLEGYAASIPLDASRYEWYQHLDHRGRPRSKVRAGRWSFVTSNLDPAHYQQLLALMLSPGTLVNAKATYGRADGQGTFVTVWGRRCSVCHVFSYFDARGTQGQQPGWTLYFTLAAEEMGRTAGAGGEFLPSAGRDYAYKAIAATKSNESEAIEITKILFSNNSLIEIRERIISGDLPRKHANLISVEEQAVIAFYTTLEGYKEFNMALRGLVSKTPFFNAQEKLLNQALGKLPKYTGSVIRGTGSTEIETFSNSTVGDTIEYKNFVSTSLDEAIADDFMYRKKGEYILRIQSKSGVAVTEMSLAPAEDEILFSSNSRFKVVGKSYRPRFTEDDPLIKEVYLEEI